MNISPWGGWVNATTGERVNDTAISYCKIPDVDHDNITDGKEIKGYKVKIIVRWKSDGMLILGFLPTSDC